MTHRRAIAGQRGAAVWTPPAGCAVWYCAALSGAVAKLGTWPDFSGNGRHGTLFLDAQVDATALALDGTGDYCRIAGTTLMDGVAVASYCAWVYLAAWRDYAGVVMTRGTAGHSGVTFGGPVDKSVTVYANSVSQASANNPIPTGQWAWICAIAGDGDQRVYVGNVLSGSATKTMTALGIDDYWRVGNDESNAARTINGYIDDVMMFPRALTAEERADIMANSPGSHAT